MEQYQELMSMFLLLMSRCSSHYKRQHKNGNDFLLPQNILYCCLQNPVVVVFSCRIGLAIIIKNSRNRAIHAFSESLKFSVSPSSQPEFPAIKNKKQKYRIHISVYIGMGQGTYVLFVQILQF